jgi:hypothetical protein
MKKKAEVTFEDNCRMRFQHHCEKYAEAKFHAEKRHYMEKAYDAIEDFLDYVGIQSL